MQLDRDVGIRLGKFASFERRDQQLAFSSNIMSVFEPFVVTALALAALLCY